MSSQAPKPLPPSNLHLRPLRFLDEAIEYYEEILMVLLSLVMVAISMSGLYSIAMILFNATTGISSPEKTAEIIPGLFQAAFTVLISMEFKSSFLSGYHNSGKKTRQADRTLNHICPVILIGILAIVRHAITLDFATAPLIETTSMSVLLISLAATYLLLRKTLANQKNTSRKTTSKKESESVEHV